VLAWAEKYNENFRIKILSDEPYFEKILNIEKERPNPRKDYAKYSDIEPLTRFFYEVQSALRRGHDRRFAPGFRPQDAVWRR
jgi:hypothetical protein